MKTLQYREGPEALENFERRYESPFQSSQRCSCEGREKEATEEGFLPRPECTQTTWFRQGLEVEGVPHRLNNYLPRSC